MANIIYDIIMIVFGQCTYMNIMNDDDNNNIILSATHFPIRSHHPERSV